MASTSTSTSSTLTSLPNHKNYYWEMALIAFDHGKIWECDMYLILYHMAKLGE